MCCITGGSEWGYLNNNQHLIFGLCNIKQLNFRHFNSNSKKFTVTVISFRKKQNRLQNCRKAVRRSFESFRSFPKISEENSDNVSTIYQGQTVHSSLKQGKDISKRDIIAIFTCERYTFYSVKTEFSSVREILVIH